VCTDCGIIVEENAIVSSVEFAEGAGGQSAMVGQFVGARGGVGRAGQYGFSRQSRENTLAAGRRRIQDVASLLRLGNQFVDAAVYRGGGEEFRTGEKEGAWGGGVFVYGLSAS